MSGPERRDARDAVTWPVRVAAAWTWRVLLLGIGVYVLAKVFVRLELVAFSFIIALFLTAVLHPLELALRRIPGPRSISAALALLIGLAILAGIGYFVSWQISSHATELGDQVTRFVHETRNWLRNGPLHLNSTDLDKIANSITNSIKKNQGQLISGAIQTVRTVAELFGALLLILLSTFFLLRDGDGIWAWVLKLFPRHAHERLDIAARAGWQTFGGYMRGQVLIALFHGVSVMILLFVLRIPLAAALGVLIFLGSFIPLVGLTITGALCVAVAGLEHGLTSAVVVAIAIIVLVQLEAHLLQPLIMSRSVEVHPLAIALAVVTGTLLAGIVGALLAVPLVAFLNSTISALRHGPASLVVVQDVPRRPWRRGSVEPPADEPGTATDEVPTAGTDGARIELPSDVARRTDGSPDV
jgi:putative heme transporter